jgi:plastocyanin
MNAPANEQRRLLLLAGGSLLLTALAPPRRGRTQDVMDIVLSGTANGANVWFRPRGLLVRRGQTVRWVNGDAGNVHTSTAYHPGNAGKPLRIPHGAPPWNSDYLLPGQSFSVTFDIPGVYDYFCVPHEHAGMVGRIIVEAPEPGAQALREASDAWLPVAARDGFVAIDRIVKAQEVG